MANRESPPLCLADEKKSFDSTTMVSKHKSSRPKLLSHTRPASVKKATSLPSHATRSLIRSHHTLQKQLHSAIARDDSATIASLQAQITAKGGLAKYQEASIQGQSLRRGGDSSRVLMEWLSKLFPPKCQVLKDKKTLKLLEVGALRTDNACSRSELLDVTRIDLHSQHPGIQTQDFMARPIPSPAGLQTEGFDIVSLSLVVNYVGDAVGRGEMLKRVSSFLRPSPLGSGNVSDLFLPALFLTLPAPCVANSRYFNEERLENIMRALGYKRVRRKISAKLVYYLWRYEQGMAEEELTFRKKQLRSGKSRNNFAVVIV